MDQHERNEKIELYGCGYDLLIEALKDIPQEMWKFQPAPGEWSVHEVLVHLADSESNAALRARKLIVEPGGTLMGYDQEKWTTALDYHDQIYEDALEIYNTYKDKKEYALNGRFGRDIFLKDIHDIDSLGIKPERIEDVHKITTLLKLK